MKVMALFLLTVAACTGNAPLLKQTPSKATIARIEHKLVHDPCAGQLDGTTRTYTYPWRGGAVDNRTIFVTLQPRDKTTPVTGLGIYDVRNDRLTLAECAKSA